MDSIEVLSILATICFLLYNFVLIIFFFKYLVRVIRNVRENKLQELRINAFKCFLLLAWASIPIGIISKNYLHQHTLFNGFLISYLAAAVIVLLYLVLILLISYQKNSKIKSIIVAITMLIVNTLVHFTFASFVYDFFGINFSCINAGFYLGQTFTTEDFGFLTEPKYSLAPLLPSENIYSTDLNVESEITNLPSFNFSKPSTLTHAHTFRSTENKRINSLIELDQLLKTSHIDDKFAIYFQLDNQSNQVSTLRLDGIYHRNFFYWEKVFSYSNSDPCRDPLPDESTLAVDPGPNLFAHQIKGSGIFLPEGSYRLILLKPTFGESTFLARRYYYDFQINYPD